MGEPHKEQDPEKGQASADAPRPSIGEGITSAITKAGDWIQATGTSLKEGNNCKSTGAQVLDSRGLTALKKQKYKQHRAKFQKSFHFIPHGEPKDTNIIGNITKLLPSNTFLMFQTLAPLATNDDNCGSTEVIMTSATLIILASTFMLACFMHTIQLNGKVYHRLVTHGGLWNPSFKRDPNFTNLRQYDHKLTQYHETMAKNERKAKKEGKPSPPKPQKTEGPYVMGSTYSSGNSQYNLKPSDYLHAVLSAMAFGTLTMLTSPVSKCFYSKIPGTVVKTLPLLVEFVISSIFAFSLPARNGIAHPLPSKVHRPSLPSKLPGKSDHDHGNPKFDDDGLGGSVKKYWGEDFGSPDHEKGKPGSPTQHHQLQDGMKTLSSWLFSKHGDDIKQSAEKTAHGLESEAKTELPGTGQLPQDTALNAFTQKTSEIS